MLYRSKKLILKGKVFVTPTFVPSISGATITDDNLVNSALNALKEKSISPFLVSIFDLTHDSGALSNVGRLCFREKRSIHDGLRVGRDKIIFTDSGGYELQTLGALLSEWDDPLQVHAYQEQLRTDIPVILDFPPYNANTIEKKKEIIQKNIDIARQIASIHSSNSWLMAIAHGYNDVSLVQCASELASIDNLQFIAMSYKEFTDYPTEQRLALIAKVKKVIEQKSDKTLFHLLAGSDISLWPFYVLLGVDTFDSSNWIDGTADINHVRWITNNNDLEAFCPCQTCKSINKPLKQITTYVDSRLKHNLDVISMLIGRIRTNVKNKTLLDFALSLNRNLCNNLESLLGRGFDSICT